MILVCSTRTMAGAARRKLPPPPPAPSLVKLVNAAWEAKRKADAEFESLVPKPVEVIETPRAKLYRIIGLVARMHGSTFADVMGGCQTPVVAAARWAAMCAVYGNCRVEGGPPTTCSVGRLFGRNHSSVHHALVMRGLKPDRSGSRT